MPVNNGKKALAKKHPRILIIDDEESIRNGCSQILARQGYEVTCSEDGLAGLGMAKTGCYAVILLDIHMPGMKGLEILRILKQEIYIPSKIIIITGFGTIQLAVEAMRLGADNFITKPFSADDLKQAVRECFAEDVADQPKRDVLSTIIGRSDYLVDLKETIRRVAKTDSTVLITGESGTGKELFARSIHSLSLRKDNPFIPVDCSSLAHNLMESELFGHVKGAFSGATTTREGRFQMADKGTLFLDEIANISLDVQAKLLRVIQEQEVPRVGSSTPEKVDVRLITATNRDLRQEVRDGNFREDLFYRISVVPIHIKPLREHPSDVAPIAAHYFDLFRMKYGSKTRRISAEAMKSLISYGWPGNIRELKNTMERLCVLCEREEVNLSDILYYGQDTTAKAPVIDPFSGRMTLVDVEKEHIEKALAHFNGQINKTAKFLDIDRKTLRTKIRNYGIDIKEES